jgi:tripartite-type tricarboxylate transporter receptor subunit TctC
MVQMKYLGSSMLVLLAALISAVPSKADSAADNYPARPIKVVVPLSPGTTTDLVARIFAERLSQTLEQSVIVENKQGAGGTLAAKVVASAAPDGYTLGLVNSQHSINPAVYKTLPYRTLEDFDAVALVAESPSTVVVAPQLGVRSIGEFIAYAKKHPNEINYASSGIGSQTHLAGAYFATEAGISMVHVPYRDSSVVVSDMITNRAQATFVPPGFLLGQIKDGKLLALAVTSREGIASPFKAPSVNEAAIPGYEYNTWFGFLAPAGVPAPIMEKLAHALETIAGEPTVKQKLEALGITPRSRTLQAYQAYIKADVEKQAMIVKAAGLTPH